MPFVPEQPGSHYLADQLLETWAIHNRIQLYLLAAIDESALGDTLGPRGRTVGDHISHAHNVRLMWLKSAAPGLLEGLSKLEGDATKDKEAIARGLTESGEAIGKLIALSLESGGKVKGFKPHITGFVAYLISHESYHIGKVDLLLRQAGHPMDDKTHYGLWEWGVR